ncbi:MAG TPA: hypothetical protein VFR97_13180 [Capillimicrobium sp.]|nr:hypothetical protein [Capillimicrobium sp.]
MLFSDRERTDPSVSREQEAAWTFLDRVDSPVFDRVRRLLDAWFGEYPSGEQEELRRRIASRDDVEFYAAWLELYLHAVHRALGFEVIAHPSLGDVTTRPDFRLRRGDQVILLEATVVGNREGAGRRGRIARIIDAVNRTRSEEFDLIFEIEQEGQNSPSMRDIRRRLERWLQMLNWDEVRLAHEHGAGFDALPARTERVDDWEFSFEAWPREAHRRGRIGSAICAGPSDGTIADQASTLRDRLEAKARKYGVPSAPTVIALGMDRLGADADDVECALLGPKIGRVVPENPAVIRSAGKRGTGFFRDTSGRMRNRHVSGVLVFDVEFRPWSVARVAPVLWLHPDPAHAVSDSLPWDRVDLKGDRPRIIRGTFEPTQVFELPDAALFENPRYWPGEPFQAVG